MAERSLSASKPQSCREQIIRLADERAGAHVRSRQNPPELAPTNRVIDHVGWGKLQQLLSAGDGLTGQIVVQRLIHAESVSAYWPALPGRQHAVDGGPNFLTLWIVDQPPGQPHEEVTPTGLTR